MILESNAQEITPVNLWMDGVTKTVDVLTMDNYVGYDFRGTPGQVYWTLNKYSERTEPDGTITGILTPITSGKMELSKIIADSWGQNDQVIFDFVASQLNLNLI